jgi:chemotaxis protein methyltransferase CheR
VQFQRQDIRTAMPESRFDLILCRNLVFTYFDQTLQNHLLEQMMQRLRPGGWLVAGIKERLPSGVPGLTPVSERLGLYSRSGSGNG